MYFLVVFFFVLTLRPHSYLVSVTSGDFLLSHYHLFSYLDIDVLRSPPITKVT